MCSGDHGYIVYFSDVNTFWLVSGNKLLQLGDCVHMYKSSNPVKVFMHVYAVQWSVSVSTIAGGGRCT